MSGTMTGLGGARKEEGSRTADLCFDRLTLFTPGSTHCLSSAKAGRENDDNVFYILDGCDVFAVRCGFPVCGA